MNKVLFVLLVLSCWTTAAPTALAQPSAKPLPTAAGLKQNIAAVASSTEGGSNAADSLTAATAKQLVAYLKAHEVSAVTAKNLGLGYVASREASYLKVFTYEYSSGGTRGTIHRPVLQWKNAAGQLFAYAVAEESDFYEIHRLVSPGRTLYLLLGGDKGDSNCYNYEAYVVELKGNYLVLTNAVFGKKPSFCLCNVPMSFEASRQILRLDLTDYSTEHDEKLLPEWGRRAGKSMRLQFDGQRFVRQ